MCKTPNQDPTLTVTLHLVDVRLTSLINITYLLTYLLTYLDSETEAFANPSDTAR